MRYSSAMSSARSPREKYRSTTTRGRPDRPASAHAWRTAAIPSSSSSWPKNGATREARHRAAGAFDLAGPHAAHRRQHRLERRSAADERRAALGVVLRPAADREAGGEAAAGELVHGRELLREHDRVL